MGDVGRDGETASARSAMSSPDTVGRGIFMLVVSCALDDMPLWNFSVVGGLMADEAVTGTDPRESSDLERWARNTEPVLLASVSLSQEIICSFNSDNIEPPRSGDGRCGSSSMYPSV
jgi:hypothetical protein